MPDEEKRPVGRPKNVPAVIYGEEEPPMAQSDENILLNNLRAMDEFGNLLILSCKLLRQKAQLVRQVDQLTREVADLRVTIQRDQQRLDTLASARRELVTG